MRPSTFFTAGLAAVASAAPLEARAGLPGTFEVSNFSFGCTVTCDWSFDVSVAGRGQNHPALKEKVSCSGNLDDKDYVECSAPTADNKRVYAYINDNNNNLKLQYEVSFPNRAPQGERYMYYGKTKVNAETSGKPQAKKFSVEETSSSAVA